VGEVKIPYGEKKLILEVPDKNLAVLFDPPFPPPIRDLSGEILRVLDGPVAGPKFSSQIGRGKRVLILIDNFARLTPAAHILPPILKKLKRAGAKVEILVASGALREMHEAELKRKLGQEILEGGIPVFQSRCKDSWDFEFIGTTTLGTPVNVHRKLLRADFSLAVTMTQATLWGYGGGGSMVLPGICSYETIEWNHRLTTGPYSGLGYQPPRNIMRQDIEEAAAMSGLSMSLLVVLNPDLEVVEVTAGETNAACRASVAKYDRYYTLDRRGLAGGGLDIAVSGSFAGDRFFAHSCWPAANLDFFTKDGGTIIIATPAPGGLAHYAYAKDYMPPDRNAFRRLYEDIFYGKQPLWHSCLWMPILRVLSKKEIIVVTERENLAAFQQARLPAVTSIEEAFRAAMKKHGRKASVGVFPYGKWILPKGLNERQECYERKSIGQTTEATEKDSGSSKKNYR
jgi:nickel-dependent lactate racemase